MNKTAVYALIAVLMWASASHAQSPADIREDPEDKKAPLEVTSERMVSDNKNNKISFYGNVVAIKGKLKVEANEMLVWTDDEQKDFKEIEATGSVRITREGKVATGEKAHYYAGQKKIILTGDPVLKDGKNVAKGEKVIYYFDKEDMEIFGGEKTPSTVILYPEEETEGGTGNP